MDFEAKRPESLGVRADRIRRAIALLVDHGDELAAAMSADFGNRSRDLSMLTDMLPAVSLGKYCLKNLKRWTRPERRKATFPLGLIGGRAEVRHEPKGVVGVISPWNFPVGLSFGPMIQAFAAGNRVMLKPSEFTERTSGLMADLVARYFAPEEAAVVTGGPDVAAAFTTKPFDHLVFTGSTATGRKVMEAAASNLVPVTLELGGKSPVFLGRSADIKRAAERIAIGKLMNAGQVCLAPDYLLVPEEREEDFIAVLAGCVGALYPTILANEDYTTIVNDQHFQRLEGLIADAAAKGAEAIVVNPAEEDFSGGNDRKLPPTILRNVNDDMEVMQQEIFGPVLPVMTYRSTDEAIAYVNAHDRPLGLYYFGEDRAEQEQVLARTISGGVTVNDVILHIAQDDLPFGGIGPSGMGNYHGPEGFHAFSHTRAIYRQPRWDVAALSGLKPPYGAATRRALKMLLRK
ncbi:coniferyl aldehyde dehydrogenase [Erythrobacter sp. SG61-1L]|uniref:coniferyl aldehyde dehydrogenase n=1 Tax=Erythrobacter sp. SG61-1L TaxID=1603897 RepID=UPI001F516F8E|nr:coniferyl aldehyde dehydrogenase [Erythrobacter sp. SG61-1L]